jgi:hypothetical protein
MRRQLNVFFKNNFLKNLTKRFNTLEQLHSKVDRGTQEYNVRK